MKKFIISLAIIAFLFAVFFLLLKWTDTPMNLALAGAGVITILLGTYAGLSFIGKPLEIIKLHHENYTDAKKAGIFLATFVMCLTATNAIIKTIEATIETLPFVIYGIALVISVILGIINRKIFLSLAAEEKN